jgi:hypothetical protein
MKPCASLIRFWRRLSPFWKFVDVLVFLHLARWAFAGGHALDMVLTGAAFTIAAVVAVADFPEET